VASQESQEGANPSSLESDIESGEFERDGCKPPSPVIADNRFPSPSDDLRYRDNRSRRQGEMDIVDLIWRARRYGRILAH
jgi:hypothetical protein